MWIDPFRFGWTKKQRNKKKKEKIQKGWHSSFAWLPTKTLSGKWVWFDKVEKKYYAPTGRRVVKKNLNLDLIGRAWKLKTMYRLPRSNKEKTVYAGGNSIYVDPDEMFRNSNILDKLN